MWTYESIVDPDPATRLNDLRRQGATVEVLHVLPPGRDRGGLLIRFSEPEPPKLS
jgi:hypothetical protein